VGDGRRVWGVMLEELGNEVNARAPAIEWQTAWHQTRERGTWASSKAAPAICQRITKQLIQDNTANPCNIPLHRACCACMNYVSALPIVQYSSTTAPLPQSRLAAVRAGRGHLGTHSARAIDPPPGSSPRAIVAWPASAVRALFICCGEGRSAPLPASRLLASPSPPIPACLTCGDAITGGEHGA
jgi:hypothetical protein